MQANHSLCLDIISVTAQLVKGTHYIALLSHYVNVVAVKHTRKKAYDIALPAHYDNLVTLASTQGNGGFGEDNRYLGAYKGKGSVIEAGAAFPFPALEAYVDGLPQREPGGDGDGS